MNGIIKNRFWTWLMFVLPIACTGFFSLYIWTIVQILICCHEIKKYDECRKPLKERKDIIEMNKPENLTEDDKKFIKEHCTPVIKIAEGVYIYDKH